MGSGVGQFVASRLHDGIVLTNASSAGSGAISEWVLGRLLQIVKEFRRHDDQARSHRWAPGSGGRLEGSTLTVVGLGAIGREVAKRSRAFGVHVIGVRRSDPPTEGDPDVDELVAAPALHQALSRSDIVVCTATGSLHNENLFDHQAFAAIKRGAIFVNVARGTLVDEDALMAALSSGHLCAAAIDVTRVEPLPAESPLWDTPNLYISPHCSPVASDYPHRVVELFYANLGRYKAGVPLHNVVDLSTTYGGGSLEPARPPP
jgi:phosphoglycerate dehydrogenase-like enzyme